MATKKRRGTHGSAFSEWVSERANWFDTKPVAEQPPQAWNPVEWSWEELPPSRQWCQILEIAANYAGVGLLWESDGYLLIGTRFAVEPFVQFYKEVCDNVKGEKRLLKRLHSDCFFLFYDADLDETVWKNRIARIRSRDVLHKFCELYPDFRDLTKTDKEQEVYLKPSDRLGGIFRTHPVCDCIQCKQYSHWEGYPLGAGFLKNRIPRYPEGVTTGPG